MKKIIFILTALQFSALTALAQTDSKTVDQYQAKFNPATASAACIDFFGADHTTIVEYEDDGRINAQLNIIKNSKGKITDLEMNLNHKAFIPFFTPDKTPVRYEDGPTMVGVHRVNELLPKVFHMDDFRLHGYGIAFIRTTVDVEKSANGSVYIKELLEHSKVSQPKASDIDAIRTAELLVNSKEIILKVTREFSMSNPRVPKHYKGSERTQDVFCKLDRK